METEWGRVIEPEDLEGEDGAWMRVAATAGGRAGLATEGELSAAREACRALAATNEFAINGHENRINYLVGAGHGYRVRAKAGRGAEALALRVAEHLEAFREGADWRRLQQEIVLRKDRDGEAFLQLFPGRDGKVELRMVEPDQVATPTARQGERASRFGVETEAEDTGRVRGYWIDGRWVDARRVQHRKANVDSTVRRGRPLFLPVLKNLRRAEKLLRNMSVVAEIQSAVALVRKHAGTRANVEQFVRETTGGRRGESGRPQRRYGPGAVLDVQAGVEYEFPATGLDAGRFVQVLQAELRAVASRLVMPEFMLTSDASNANYASTLVAEGPAVRMFQRLQGDLLAEDAALFRRVVEFAVEAGRLPAEAVRDVTFEGAAPSAAVRDLLAETRAAAIEFEHGVLSAQTWSQRRGLDYEQEQEQRKRHAGREGQGE